MQLSNAFTENEALKRELNAFDPAFWNELEDLKYERQEFAEKVEAYARTIRSLSSQLGITPPL